ncbi:MAG: alpha/beta hydrolase [Pseudomonadota bacterium]
MSEPDYDRLIDAEMWDYISAVDACYPPDPVVLSIAEQRAVYDAMARRFHQGRPAGVKVRDQTLGEVRCRFYEVGENDVTVLYLHGGGFVVGGLDSHDDVCAELCARTGFRIVSADYGLAPEVVFPGCFNDAWKVFEVLAGAPGAQVVLAGDSAGGNLAAAIAHQARGDYAGRVLGQVLIYPGLGGDERRGSYVEHAEAPHLTAADLAFYREVRIGGAAVAPGDARFAPLWDHDFSGLPPTVIVTAQCDPLASDGEAYRDALRAAGGRAEWINVAGMVHGCLRARGMSARAAGFFDEVVGAVGALGQGAWHYTA